MELKNFILDVLEDLSKNNDYVTTIQIRNHLFEKHRIIITSYKLRKILLELNWKGVLKPYRIDEIENIEQWKNEFKELFGEKWNEEMFNKIIFWKIDKEKLRELRK